ncbi:hypothetical protein HQ531_03235 [bacterium]|nr:hypothetical protein [bacterium]
MNIILLVIAAIAFITGLLLIVAPNILVRAGEILNQIYNVESFVYAKRKTFGLVFILMGLVYIWVIW